jgi:hypothetical protein
LSAWLMDANTAALSARLPCHLGVPLLADAKEVPSAHDCIPFSLTCTKRFEEPTEVVGTCTDDALMMH